MSITEILIVVSVFLILVDIFFASDIPTHIAYVLTTINIAKEIDMSFLYQATFAILIWFGLVAFHYFIWRNVLEKINDKFISPRKHIGGIDGLVGKIGTIKSIDGELFISVDEELYRFETIDGQKRKLGKTYKILKVESDILFI
jgi:hypothetical protein